MINQHDIQRLANIITLIKKIEDIFQDMEEDEFDRMKMYVHSRFGVIFPNYSIPWVKKDKQLKNNSK